MSRLQDINWGTEAFTSLVIPQSQKSLVLSLVKQHVTIPATPKTASPAERPHYDDIVATKGLGLIGLLSGRPGCGKTLTAEAVAEATHKALYTITAGELGTNPADVDKQLTLVLELSHRWSAVLLLDEADVFLQARDTTDVVRNALVSVFLRQLEYFRGVMILTTNRVRECDPAFESTVISLKATFDFSYF